MNANELAGKLEWIDQQDYDDGIDEPVGYFRKNYDGDWVESEAEYWDKAIPLYTHPATLTDEKIEKIAEQYFNNGKEIKPLQELKIGLLGLELFARAILRKAQEK